LGGYRSEMMRSVNPFSRCCERRRTYDHRIRKAVCDASDPALFDACLTIPRSTARSWLRRGRTNVVSLDEGDFEVGELQLKIAALKHRIQKYSKAARNLAAVVRLQRAELEASGASLEHRRVPSASVKTRIIAAVARARALLPLVLILKILRLSSARYHAWVRVTTLAILREAAGNIGITPTLVADSGVENVNGDADALVGDGVVNRVLALVEVAYSTTRSQRRIGAR